MIVNISKLERTCWRLDPHATYKAKKEYACKLAEILKKHPRKEVIK